MKRIRFYHFDELEFEAQLVVLTVIWLLIYAVGCFIGGTTGFFIVLFSFVYFATVVYFQNRIDHLREHLERRQDMIREITDEATKELRKFYREMENKNHE
jgi:DNA integrity scanning protein DisA with diadenylate cyclase activity